ncbi:unnamed protein product [Cunninghamella blakesleeana]
MDLAHAKYTMGAKTISHYSYDERMKAKLQIKINSQNDQPFEMITPPPPTEEETAKKKESKNKEGLRQRKESTINKKKHDNNNSNESEWMQKDPNDITEKEEYEMDEKKPKKKEKRNIIKASNDPLHWFGLLVSPSLRTSQAHFKSATTQLIEIINLVHELDKLEEEYIHLEQKKQELLQAKQQQERETLQVNT